MGPSLFSEVTIKVLDRALGKMVIEIFWFSDPTSFFHCRLAIWDRSRFKVKAHSPKNVSAAKTKGIQSE